MSLIEKYGSYEQAVKTLWQEQEEGYPGDDIARELLEYRRQNNLITVGDWIFIEDYKPEFQLHKVTADDMGSHWIKLVKYRHATDEEIKKSKAK